MESISICLSSSPPLANHPQTPKPTSKYNFLLPNCISCSNSISHQTPFPFTPSHTPIHKLDQITTPQSSNLSLNSHLSFLCMGFSFPLSSLASENVDQVSNKINLEAILVSIDDFFNRYPFFVAGVTFIWLIVIPLTQDYLQKFKFISAINAFRKLRDDPNAQLIDIRDNKSLGFLSSPNLKLLNKTVVQVQFSEENEDSFVKRALQKLKDPENTTICILDNFDGNSMKVAELLFKNGFKEAYAIRGGVRGKNGWLAIQETLLPPSVHIFPKKKVKKSQQFEMNGGVNQQTEDNGQFSSVGNSEQIDNGFVNKSIEPTPKTERPRSLSPYSKVDCSIQMTTMNSWLYVFSRRAPTPSTFQQTCGQASCAIYKEHLLENEP